MASPAGFHPYDDDPAVASKRATPQCQYCRSLLGPGLLISAFYGCLKFGLPHGILSWTLLSLLVVWGIRLSAYLFIRNFGKGEDPRYQAFRAKYGSERYWYVSLFQVFWLQGFIMWIVFLPVTAIWMNSGAKLGTGIAAFGLVLWIIGFLFEAVGDWQLWRFKRNP